MTSLNTTINPGKSSKTFGIGEPVDRVDGVAKVTGKACYAAEHRLNKTPLISWIVESTIAAGTIKKINTEQAEQAPGVKLVLTHENAPSQRPFGEPTDEGRFTQSRAMLQSKKIRYHGFPVALVVAETFAQAQYAGSLIHVEYESSNADIIAGDDADKKPDSLDGGMDADVSCGDFAQVYATATHTVDVTYTTPNQVAAAMEPHACIADWDGNCLHVYMSVQIVASAVEAIANTLQIDKNKIKVSSPFIGGGFGSKLGVHNETILASLAALTLQRPVKVEQTRRNLFSNAPHRGNSVQKIKLGADKRGELLAVSHESFMPVAKDYDFAEPTGAGVRATYAAETIISTHRVKPVNMPTMDSTRAPGDAIGSLAYEAAIDELAHKVGMDPLEFRLFNLPDKHPVNGKPFASNDLKGCLEEGAECFGWHAFVQSDKEKTIKRGIGVACAVRFNTLVEAEAEISLDSSGNFIVATDMTDIGTGTYTILTQIVAENFGITPKNITINLGSSDSPPSSGSGGSFGAGSTGSAVFNACQALKKELLTLAKIDNSNSNSENVEWRDGHLITGNKKIKLKDLLLNHDKETIHAKGKIAPDENHENYEQYSYGAQFAEVSVDTATGEIRVERLLGVFSAGKILNPKTAASQLKGGMVWGLSYALFEELMLDERYGVFINRDLAEYHIPVNRDIPPIDIFFREQPDFKSNPLGSKGIGELGITGAGAAVANAVYNATGVRIRDYPITLDKVLAELEKLYP